MLIISFKRFQNDGKKINKLIKFPVDNLDLNDYCIDKREQNNVFSLYGVVNHYGGYNSGHYKALCKNNGSWLEFNDNNVSEVKNIVTNAAYILFYKKNK